LQTLYSVFYHRFNGRVLYFNLLFDEWQNEQDETGFYFKSAGDKTMPHELAIPELTGKSTIAEKIALRERLMQGVSLSAAEKTLIETNFERLWSVFVSLDIRSIAYFPVRSKTEVAVNEVFRRLNTGGVPLTQLEMVLGKLKERDPYFEESLLELSRQVREATGTPGVEFSAHEIVQLMYLLLFRTTRVDVSRVTSSNIADLLEKFVHVRAVLPDCFKAFLYEEFRINAKWLLLRQQALLPILVYFVTLEEHGYVWSPYKLDLGSVRTYFIKSQLCDWNTQTMVTAFSNEAIDSAAKNAAFPLDAVTQIAIDKNRTGEVYYYQLEGPVWFSLKILTPSRLYLFNERKPQIDHVFPKALHDKMLDKAEYRQRVDVLWNMQPTPAGLNNFKRAKHPRAFFESGEGAAYLSSYDYLPELDGEYFDDDSKFIAFRRAAMVNFMKKKYGIELKENPV